MKSVPLGEYVYIEYRRDSPPLTVHVWAVIEAVEDGAAVLDFRDDSPSQRIPLESILSVSK